MPSQAVNNIATSSAVLCRFHDWSQMTDGDADKRPTIPDYELTSLDAASCGWDRVLAQECVAHMPHLNNGTIYKLRELPEGYTLYVKNRNRSPGKTGKRDFQVYGHPGPNNRYFRSAKTLAVHLVWLLDPNKGACECNLCGTIKISDRAEPRRIVLGHDWGTRGGIGSATTVKQFNPYGDLALSEEDPDNLNETLLKSMPHTMADDVEFMKSQDEEEDTAHLADGLSQLTQEQEDWKFLAVVDPRILTEEVRAARELLRLRYGSYCETI